MTKNPLKNRHKARKRFGQNFLHDVSIIERIIECIKAHEHQHIVEIGPGQGAITEPLLECTQGRLSVIELDKDLIPWLNARFDYHDGFRLHQGDALHFNFNQIINPGETIRLVGNLPYNISTPLMFHLLSFAEHIEDMHFMLQKEVVERLCAKPNTKSYGRLSIVMQYYCETEQLFNVPASAFQPQPKVESAIVRLTPRKHANLILDSEDDFKKIVQASFAQRRKTIKNNLKSWLQQADYIALNIDPSVRAETLPLESYVKITNYIHRKSL